MKVIEPFKGIALDAVVFICGAALMIFEITGSRVVSPYIGTSTYVWTSLIGIILASLSLGYWMGGRMADRSPRVSILASAIFSAAFLLALTILIKDPLLAMIAAGGVSIELKAVIASILLFAPASIALGFVTPYAVKLRITSLGEAGRTVGRLYALSTIGSIGGTFAAGFALIPFLGTDRTLYSIAAGLMLTPFLLVPFALDRKAIGGIVILCIAVLAGEGSRYAMWSGSRYEDIDTRFSRVQIFDTTDTATGREITAMTFDPYSTQSAIFRDGNELVFEYTKFYHLVRVIKPDFQRSLMIGGAGFSFPKAYLEAYPHASLEVAEIDPAMTEIARRRFRLRDDPRLTIFHEDGRVFLNSARAGSYDAVLMDAFGSMFSVPWQLTTVEAVRQMDRILKNDGVVIFNLGSAIRGPASLFLQAEFAAYRSVFPHVYLFKVRPERPDTDLQNLIVVACKQECLPADTAGDEFIGSLLGRQHTGDFPLEVPAPTDDLAPIERYNSIAQAFTR
ncbi:MAG: fused MFS/spermidine synthase [Pyrinomonadaceae bacterium]